LIGVAAAGVMALAAQTAAAQEVVKYDTKLTITTDRGDIYHGYAKSEVRKCEQGRRVIAFKQQLGADRKLGTDRSDGQGSWWTHRRGDHVYVGGVYAKVERKVRDRFVCHADRSETLPKPGATGPLGDHQGFRSHSQRPAASAGVVKYDTELTVTKDRGANYHGWVESDRDRNPEYDPAKAVRKCMDGRRVNVFRKRAGADPKLGTVRSKFEQDYAGNWWLYLDRSYDHRHVYAKVERKVRDRFVCRADRSAFHL